MHLPEKGCKKELGIIRKILLGKKRFVTKPRFPFLLLWSFMTC